MALQCCLKFNFGEFKEVRNELTFEFYNSVIDGANYTHQDNSLNATKETQSKHASRKMLSVLTGSFDKTEKLAPSSQQVCLTFLLKKFFELSEIDSAESKNKKSAFFLSKNRSMNYPDG